jgi:hypothetical protein
MHLRALLFWALTALVFVTPGSTRAGSAEPAARPAVLVRLKALEDLIGDLRFLVKEIGREEQARQVEAMLKARTGPKGLEGVDVKKPIGLFANIKPSLNQSEVMLLLPIADEKTFLEFLDTLNFKPEKGKDDLYTLQIENIPVPLLFRFANGYLYGTAKLNDKMTLPARDRLPNPEKLLAGSSMMSLTVNVDQIPEQVRKLGISATALTLGEIKDQAPPGLTDKQKAIWETTLDESARIVKEFLEDARAAQWTLDLDKKTKDVSLSFRLDGKAGSTLVKNLAGLVPTSSPAAGLVGKDSVMGGILSLALPEPIRKATAPAIDEAIAKALDGQDANVKDLLEPLVDTLKPTAKAGKFDLGVEMRGPAKKGKYSLVACLQVEKGEAIEKAFKDLLDKLPADVKEPITTDVAKVGSVNIHRIKQKDVDKQAREMFGDGPLYLAVRGDALFLSMGEEALEAIKEAVGTKPKTGQPVRLTLSVARLVPFMVKEQKEAPAAARKAFKEKDSDSVRLSLSSGDRLELKLSIKTAVLAFASYLEQMKAKE